MKKKLVAIPLLALVVLGTITFLAGKTPDVAASQIAGILLPTEVHTQAELTIQITHRQQTSANLGWLLSMWAKGQFWTPDCWYSCRGVTYTLDPTVSIMNRGKDFEQCKVFGTAGTITCTAADTALYLSVSTSNTVTVTDTACPATVQTTNGFSVALGVETAGAAGATVTTLVAFTWTATGAVGPVSLACLQTEASGGGNVVLYLEGQFGPDTLANTDTLKITASIART